MSAEGIMKGASSRYWKICRISSTQVRTVSPANYRSGYEYFPIPTAQSFVQETIASPSEDMQAGLLSYFHGKNPTIDLESRAYAGLCLRCYVSEPILKACKKIDHLFGGDKSFTYEDLLGFVLNDDGEKLVILDSDRKTQLVLNRDFQANPTSYQYFTVRVLQTFKEESRSRMSLDNWAYLQTKQNPELKDFLAEYGFKHLTDWALLNRTRTKQLEKLSIRDRALVEIFHGVYRRDRIQNRQASAKSSLKCCPDPSKNQLEEMLKLLKERDISINSTSELMKALKNTATQLRQYDIWSYREPLEIQDSETGGYAFRSDLPHASICEVDVEERELLEYLHDQLKLTVNQVIEQEIRNCIARLKKSKKYAPFADKFVTGMQLYYSDKKSLQEITHILKMSSWDQARRILNPSELVAKVREQTTLKLLDSILKLAQQKGLTQIPPEPDYLKILAEQIEIFADDEVFQAAAEEIRAGKNRSLNSPYAQMLKQILSNIHQLISAN
jgi:hypothetical protein